MPARLLSWLVGAPARAGADEPAGQESWEEPAAVFPAAACYQVESLREAWRSASVDSGWMSIGDWWHPACDALIEALAAHADPSAAIARLGQARAELGCTIEESIDDLLALWWVYARTDPSAPLLRTLAGGWAEAGLMPVGAGTCTDPMTQLATRAYLETRLAELYRDARPGHPSDLYNLVVVDIDQGLGLMNLPEMSRVAEALRRCCSHGEPIARIAPGRAVALVRCGPTLAAKLDELHELLCGSEESQVHAVIWVEALPRTFGCVPGLLLDLSR